MIKKILLLSMLSVCVFEMNLGKVYAMPPQQIIGGAESIKVIGEATSPRQQAERLDNPIQSNDLKSLLASLVDLAIVLGTIVAVLMFIWIGFQFVTAQGDEGKIKDAKEWFTYAVIGTAILIGSKVILEVIKSTLIDSGLVQDGLF